MNEILNQIQSGVEKLKNTAEAAKEQFGNLTRTLNNLKRYVTMFAKDKKINPAESLLRTNL